MPLENISSKSYSYSDVLVQLTKTKRLATGEEKLEVDLNSVNTVLGNPSYKDCHVAIYTIAGPGRSGKSFLLSLFWLFLQRSKEINGYHQWFTDTRKLTKIFRWKKGPKACTKGIYILKQPIIFSLEEKKIALFLADTQGMFDHNASEQDQSFLGTFCFLFSSFLIFNVDKRIDTTHLQSIHRFATNLRGSDGCFAMQKKSLMFVVRDWISIQSNDDSDSDDGYDDDGGDDDSDNGDDEEGETDNLDYGYGLDGGKEYFQTLIRNDSPNKAKEHQMMRDYLDYAFGEEIPCWLLPHPGDAVYRKHCCVADLNECFRRETFNFFNEIKNKTKFKIKQIQNQDCKCGELSEAIKDYVSLLGPNLDVAGDNSFFLQDFKVKMSRRVRNSVEEFLQLAQNEKVKSSYEDNKKSLVDIKTKIILKFRKEAGKFYPNTSMVLEWEQELDRLLSQAVRNMMTCLSVENAYRNAIVKYSSWLRNAPRIRSIRRTKTFVDGARKLRCSLLQRMKKSILQDVEEGKRFEDIFLQSKKYFELHTNKLTAAIDDDIEDFLRAMISPRTKVVHVCVILGSLISNATDSASDLGVTAAIDGTTEQIKIGADKNNSISFLGLHQYEYGKMIVKLAFGTISFKLEVRNTSPDNSPQVPEIVRNSNASQIAFQLIFGIALCVFYVCKKYFENSFNHF